MIYTYIIFFVIIVKEWSKFILVAFHFHTSDTESKIM